MDDYATSAFDEDRLRSVQYSTLSSVPPIETALYSVMRKRSVNKHSGAFRDSIQSFIQSVSAGAMCARVLACLVAALAVAARAQVCAGFLLCCCNGYNIKY